MKSTENVIYGILISIIVVLIVMKLMRKDKYSLSPQTISINQVNPKGPQSIFDLPYTLDCVPGPTAAGSNYTKSLTPGGFCGAGQWVANQANYTITGGIGGEGKLGD
jgi:hypothetical protein